MPCNCRQSFCPECGPGVEMRTFPTLRKVEDGPPPGFGKDDKLDALALDFDRRAVIRWLAKRIAEFEADLSNAALPPGVRAFYEEYARRVLAEELYALSGDQEAS